MGRRSLTVGVNRETLARLEYLSRALAELGVSMSNCSRLVRAVVALLWFFALTRPGEFRRLVEEFRESGLGF